MAQAQTVPVAERPQDPAQAPQSVGKPAQEKAPIQVAQIFEQPGVLTPHGRLVLEPSLEYSYSTSNRVALIGYTIIPAITIGLIDIREVNRSAWIGALTARYGLTNHLELEARVPYVYRSDDTLTRPIGTGAAQDSVFTADSSDLGDVELTARYQINDGGAGSPYYIASLRAKSRTGTGPFEVPRDPETSLETQLATGSGFWGIEPGITLLYPSDPAVFFGSARYLWNIERDVGGDFGTIDPGDAVTLNLGMGLALNEQASFSIGYEHSVIGKDKQNGQTTPTSMTTQLGTLLLGYSFRVGDRTNASLSIGAGLTEATPDVQLTLRAPVMF